MKQHLPNLLTVSRLVMAAIIFVLLARHDAAGAGSPYPATAASGSGGLDLALAIFLLALATDILDGYLARRLNAHSTFGRIADPFADKVLVCGTFAFLAGENFYAGAGGTGGPPLSVTGVAVWMVVLIFAREIFVTVIRSLSESRGEPFTATVFGKAKMSLQCLAIAYILIFAGHGRGAGPWATTLRDVLIWAMLAFTALSILAYAGRTRRLLWPEKDANKPG